MINSGDWKQSNLQVFWGEIAPCNHLVQIYEDDKVFMDSLEGFAGSGFLAGESVIIIATAAHLNTLEIQLKEHGLDLDTLIADNKYIPLNAEEALSRFMIAGWPDEDLFMEFVTEVITRARKNANKIRAFGEMVAVLWAQGNNGATVRLEHLWNMFAEKESFCLFCAYPKSGFTEEANISIQNICKAHSKVIGGWQKPSTEIFYKNAAPYVF